MSINPAYRLMHGRPIMARPPWYGPDPLTNRTAGHPRCDCQRDGEPLGGSVPEGRETGEAPPMATEAPAALRTSRPSAVQREVSPYLLRRLRSLEEVLQQRAGNSAKEDE
ncbi:hypothetical protein ABIE65_003318 [Constrictibacter sp. MBR-5]|jgi:hypothetical protein|uniref:hypothetical protein n=1 Tax=Constrictibacter sp. MBR-5 TaxID=3156467 RepID=UPI0033943545